MNEQSSVQYLEILMDTLSSRTIVSQSCIGMVTQYILIFQYPKMQ